MRIAGRRGERPRRSATACEVARAAPATARAAGRAASVAGSGWIRDSRSPRASPPTTRTCRPSAAPTQVGSVARSVGSPSPEPRSGPSTRGGRRVQPDQVPVPRPRVRTSTVVGAPRQVTPSMEKVSVSTGPVSRRRLPGRWGAAPRAASPSCEASSASRATSAARTPPGSGRRRSGPPPGRARAAGASVPGARGAATAAERLSVATRRCRAGAAATVAVATFARARLDGAGGTIVQHHASLPSLRPPVPGLRPHARRRGARAWLGP